MQTPTNLTVMLEGIIGIILLMLPIIGVLLFVIYLLFSVSYKILQSAQLGDEFMGSFYNGVYISFALIYLGLMAIVEAILLKGTDKK